MRGGARVGAVDPCAAAPSLRRQQYVTRNALYEPSTADINVWQGDLYLISLYVFLSPSATGTSPYRVRIWDTAKASSVAVAVTSDLLIWQSESVSVGGVFYWEPPPEYTEVVRFSPMHERQWPVGPHFDSGLRVQMIDQGNSDAVLAASSIRVFSTFLVPEG